MTTESIKLRQWKFVERTIEDVCSTGPFIEQRDIDTSRLKSIRSIMEKNLKKYKSVFLDAPVILIECMDNDLFLLDADNKRTNSVIVDGQHRVAALRLIINGTNSRKIKQTTIPVMVHQVNTLDEARQIQYNIFEQKPVNDYDKLQQKSYKLQDVIDKFNSYYTRGNDNNKKIAQRCFVQGKFGDKGRKFRKYHFLLDELTEKIKSSTNISIWVKREIQHTEIDSALNTISKRLIDDLNNMKTLKEQMKFVHITTEHNLTLFKAYILKMPFQILPYVFYKKYDDLVNELEHELYINDEEDDDTSDVDNSCTDDE